MSQLPGVVRVHVENVIKRAKRKFFFARSRDGRIIAANDLNLQRWQVEIAIRDRCSSSFSTLVHADALVERRLRGIGNTWELERGRLVRRSETERRRRSVD